MGNPNAWRPIIAALANDEARRMYALIVHGGLTADVAATSSAKSSRAIDALLRAGLIVAVDGGYEASAGVFADALAASPAPQRRTGIGRFLTEDGRVDRYPSSADQRRELLEMIALRVLADGGRLTESELNERLLVWSDDVAELRRYLVDFGLLTRTTSGSEYTRPRR